MSSGADPRELAEARAWAASSVPGGVPEGADAEGLLEAYESYCEMQADQDEEDGWR